MNPIQWPTNIPLTGEAELGYQDSSIRNVSRNFTTQLVTDGAAIITFRGYVELYQDEVREFRNLVLSMRGMQGSFYLYPYAMNLSSRGGTGTGAVFISGSNTPLGTRVTLDGGTGSNCIAKGDFIQLGDNQTVWAMENYSGSKQTIDIYPPLRFVPTYGTTVNMTTPRLELRPMDSKRTWVMSAEDNIERHTLECVEAT